MTRGTPVSVMIGAGMALAGGIVALSAAALMLVTVAGMEAVVDGGETGGGFGSPAPVGVVVLSIAAIVLAVVVLTGRAWAATGLAIAAGCYLLLQLVVGFGSGDRSAPLLALYPIASALILQTPTARAWYRERAAARA
ncbi:hypothetical protein [Millisia brevis]|uniref:hypothetical protein n=1 Tax=Millisia brevis TaxID=264148 RepID=UPI0008377603|nr:hypothetical protein [Millisia brevis]